MAENPEIGKTDRLTARLARCLRDLRHDRGWSLDELTDRSGVSRATLSRLEHAEVSPTAQVMARIAAAYDMPVSRLVRMAEGAGAELARRGDQDAVTDPETGAGTRAVARPGGGFNAAISEATVPPGCTRLALAGPVPGAELHVVLLQGRMTVHHAGTDYALRKGDTLRFHDEGSTTVSTGGKRAARYLLITI